MFDFIQVSAPSAAVAVHLGSALAALLLGPFAIYRRQRDGWHRAAGYAWVAALAVAALSSFALPAVILHVGFGLGAIHGLAAWVLVQLALGVREARTGRIAAHRRRMAGLYRHGLAVAGLLSLLPGRLLNDALFAGRPEIGVWVILGAGAGLLWVELAPVLTARPDRGAG